MSTIAATRSAEGESAPAGVRRLGLSGKLILLTVLFMAVAEILIYVPAAAGFRRSWISDRIMGAQMVALALSSTPEGPVSVDLEAKLLAAVKGAKAIGVRGEGTRWLLATGDVEPPKAAREIDFREWRWWGPLRGLYHTLLNPPPGPIRILAPGPAGVNGPGWVEVILDEAPLREAVLGFTRDFLFVSLILATVTSALLYLALHLIVVRPVRRLSANIAGFATDPENAGRVLATTGRGDEIGIAEETLARMERVLAGELRQKRRLAELGLAVSKINHELRNMLTTAQLVSDRLGDIADPTVQRIAPRLIGTLGRAIEYCDATLAYGRAAERDPRRERVLVAPVVAEQLDLTRLGDGHPIEVAVEVPPDLVADADPEQFGRVLLNLMRNSVEALARAKTPHARIEVSAERTDGTMALTVCDNGPGIAEKARSRLFSAFQASDRSGGTGLGLPVVEELIHLHGGTIRLIDSQIGACFRITIPDRRTA